jgi:hypothetical protein
VTVINYAPFLTTWANFGCAVSFHDYGAVFTTQYFKNILTILSEYLSDACHINVLLALTLALVSVINYTRK